jgi:hypothetical protein
MINKEQVCIVIPIYQEIKDPAEKAAIQQCFAVLSRYQIYFAIPEKLESYMQSDHGFFPGKAQYKLFKNDFFADIPGYNRLLKSRLFYKEFIRYDFLLIYQPDAYVFRDELLDWCNKGFDNIGAPLFLGHEQAGKESPLVGQGNGGFCLRNIKSCYKVAASFRKVNYQKEYTGGAPSRLQKLYRTLKHDFIFNYSFYPFQPIMNEDLFWSELVPAVFPNFSVPVPEEAIGFSFEVNPEVLYQLNNHKLPFGCHAWRRYSPGFWTKFITIPSHD